MIHDILCFKPEISKIGWRWLWMDKAVDEYFQKHGIHVLLNKIDEAGRIFIKPHTSAGGAEIGS